MLLQLCRPVAHLLLPSIDICRRLRTNYHEIELFTVVQHALNLEGFVGVEVDLH